MISLTLPQSDHIVSFVSCNASQLSQKYFSETFNVNFGLHSGDTVIWLASNEYITYPANTLYRGAIAATGKRLI